jgi:cytidyltransferase-like protein
MNVVLVTGGFDPLHSGHIAYFEAAKQLGDILVVGLNSDEWLERKKGRAFMHIYEREKIVSSLKVVDKVVCYPDADGSSRNAITGVRAMYPDATIIFANGGDRTAANIPEMDVKDNNLIFKFGVGGEDKKNSSSWILEEWKAPKTERTWGNYRVLYDSSVCGRQTKVKELVVNPGQSLSMQRHKHRNEFWHVVDGFCNVERRLPSGYTLPGPYNVGPHSTIEIPKGEWHQLSNPYNVPCKIIEIQFGSHCEEEDIERTSR